MISTKNINENEKVPIDPVERAFLLYKELNPSERERLMGKIVKHITGIIEEKVKNG